EQLAHREAAALGHQLLDGLVGSGRRAAAGPKRAAAPGRQLVFLREPQALLRGGLRGGFGGGAARGLGGGAASRLGGAAGGLGGGAAGSIGRGDGVGHGRSFGGKGV